VTGLSIDERVRKAFDSGTLEKFGLRYLEAIIESWREAEQNMRRAVAFAGILVVIFFLLAHAKNAEVTFGPLKLTNVAAVLTLIPTLVAFLGHEFAERNASSERYEAVCGALVNLLAKSIRENDLDNLLAPEVVHPMGRVEGRSWQNIQLGGSRAAYAVMDVTKYIGIAVVFLGSIAFLVYAYVYLYGDRHASSAAVSIALAITAVYVIRTVAILWYSTGL
jgi:hypothetical protein